MVEVRQGTLGVDGLFEVRQRTLSLRVAVEQEDEDEEERTRRTTRMTTRRQAAEGRRRRRQLT